MKLLGDSTISLLAQSTETPGEGLTYSLEPSWSWSPVVFLLLIPAVIALVAFLYLTERGRSTVLPRLTLSTIRLLLIGLVLVMLFGWMLQRDRMDLPDVVVLLDDSVSMQFEDQLENEATASALEKRIKAVGLETPSRVNLAKALLLENDNKLLASLSSKYNLKFYRIGSTARIEAIDVESLAEVIRDIPAEQSESRLGKCLRDVLEFQRGRPTAAVIVLTDGITTDGKSIGEVADYARRKSIPLYVVGIGNDQPPRDVRLADLLVDDTVFVKDIVNFDVKLTGTGYQGESVTVRLRKGAKGPVVAEEPVTLGKDRETKSVRLSFRPEEIGEIEFVVEFDEIDGEAATENNRQSRIVNVRDEKIRVLLAQEGPSREFRFLSTLLGRQVRGNEDEANKSIELTTVFQSADEEFAQADDSIRRVFPVRREELFEFDVIIFGDVNPEGLGPVVLNHVSDFVKVRGGGIVFIAGPDHMPVDYRDTALAELMPVDASTCSVPDPAVVQNDKFNVRPTRLGFSSPQMQLGDSLKDNVRVWSNLDGLYWLIDAPDLKRGARVLAEHPTLTGTNGKNLPVISMQYVGAGKVVFHSTDETWRWRFRVGDKYFARYWIQTVRYLSRSKLLGGNRSAELVSDREVYRRGEAVSVRVRFFDERVAPPQDDGVTVVLERDEGRKRHITLSRQLTARGVFEGSITGLADGNYNLWVATPTLEGKPPSVKFSVEAPPGEQARLEMDSADLKLAAKVSHGEYYTPSTAETLLKDLPQGRQVQIASMPPVSIWGLWYVALMFAAVFVALIVSEWLMRKWCGML